MPDPIKRATEIASEVFVSIVTFSARKAKEEEDASSTISVSPMMIGEALLRCLCNLSSGDLTIQYYLL